MASTSGRPINGVVRILIVLAGTWGMAGRPAFAQDALIERPGPPPLDDLETDVNKDGVPDGWYNARDAVLMPEGGVIGPHFVRFQSDKPGQPVSDQPGFRDQWPTDRGDRAGPVGPAEQHPARRARRS